MVLFLCKMNILTFLSLLPYVFVMCFNCFNGILVVAQILCSAVGCFLPGVYVVWFVLGIRALVSLFVFSKLLNF